MSKQTRGEKGEKKVQEILDKIKDKHVVFNDVTFINKNSEMSHQIDHILVHPHGVFVIETKNYYGEILYENNRWIRRIGNRIEKLSDPLKQNKSHAVTLYKALKGKYETIPVVVFVRNNAPYMGDENVINLNDLLLFIDSYPYKHKYEDETIDKIASEIKNNIQNISKDEHLENIGFLKAVRVELRKEKEYAITKGICPRCGRKMIIKGNKFKSVDKIQSKSGYFSTQNFSLPPAIFLNSP